jgi:hypothetical protein
MIETIHKLLELITFPIELILAALGADALFLFVPDRFLSAIGLLQFRTRAHTYFGVLFFVLVGLVFFKLFKFITLKCTAYRWRKWGLKRLKRATKEEKAILAQYIKYNTKTRPLPYGNGVVRGLESDKIIYQSSSINRPEMALQSSHGIIFDYNLQDWAWDCLQEHKNEIFTP